MMTDELSPPRRKTRKPDDRIREKEIESQVQ